MTSSHSVPVPLHESTVLNQPPHRRVNNKLIVQALTYLYFSINTYAQGGKEVTPCGELVETRMQSRILLRANHVISFFVFRCFHQCQPSVNVPSITCVLPSVPPRESRVDRLTKSAENSPIPARSPYARSGMSSNNANSLSFMAYLRSGVNSACHGLTVAAGS